MSWLSQFTFVMKSSITHLREKVEDPERLLHQLLIDMEEELDALKSSVVEAMADELQLKQSSEAAEQSAQQWEQRAKKALQRGNDDDAKTAMDAKLCAEAHRDQLREDLYRHQTEVQKLRSSVNRLEHQIRQAAHKKTILVARMSRASTSSKIQSTLERTNRQSAMSQFDRLEKRVDRQEALAKAWDEMNGTSTSGIDAETDFDRREHEERVEEELELLKKQLSES